MTGPVHKEELMSRPFLCIKQAEIHGEPAGRLPAHLKNPACQATEKSAFQNKKRQPIRVTF